MSGQLEETLEPKDHGRGPYRITVSFTEREGRLECVAVHVEGLGGTTLSTTVLRSLNPATLIDEARKRLAQAIGPQTVVDPEAVQRADRQMASRPGRRPKWSAADLAKVAEVYSQAWQSNGKALRAVAKAFGVNDKTASKLVARAREFEFLAPTTRGKSSGRIVRGTAVGRGRSYGSATGRVIRGRRKA
jgi:hypothetical protein